MSSFRSWYQQYSNEITWWVIGWLSFAAIDSLIRENWAFLVLNTFLIYLNYKLWKNNNA